MLFIIRIVLSFIFLLLSALHFYWAMGGKWGLDEAVPTDLDGKKVLKTTILSCLVVGTALLLFSAYYFTPLLEIITLASFSFLGWLIPTIFLLRSIGDFKFVGFFKKTKTTRFGQLDTKYFVPLCLLLATLGFIILLM